MSQTSDEKMSPKLLNLYILFAFHCSLCSLSFLSLGNFLDDYLMYLTLIFFSVRLFHLLACAKLIGGDWYLASILIFESVFSFLINVRCTSSHWQCRRRKPQAVWSHSPHGWRGWGSALFSTSLHSLFSAHSHNQACRETGKMPHFTRISVIFFTLVRANSRYILRLFVGFVLVFLLKGEWAFLCLSEVQHISRSLTQTRIVVSKPSYYK